WVITLPHADYITDPHIFDDQDLQCRADSWFGLVDCFQWPQTYEKEYEYSMCVP
ncbi:hypothetical protein M404DRAFT_132475, partial [Pisolithus tinctorius Marx 270]